jgi:hypothetical protein
MQSTPDILVTCCLSDCNKCTGSYINDIFDSKIVCRCSCHDGKDKALARFPMPLTNAEQNVESLSQG